MTQISWRTAPTWTVRPTPNVFTSGKRTPVAIVCHIEAGSDIATQAWFANPAAQASANFSISKAGAVSCYVDPRGGYSPWANGILDGQDAVVNTLLGAEGGANPNLWTVSIEHEGSPPDQIVNYPAQFAASTQLTAWLCEQFRIPADRSHILGHYEFDSVNRPECPGWTEATWEAYMGEVQQILTPAQPDPCAAETQAMASILGRAESIQEHLTQLVANASGWQTAGATTMTSALPPTAGSVVGNVSGTLMTVGPMHNLWSIIGGINIPPQIAGFVRGILIAAAIAGIEAAINLSGTLHLSPSEAVWLPIVVLGLRTLEGVLDAGKSSTPPSTP